MSVPTQHPFPFDPTYGMSLQQLQRLVAPEAPPDYDDFWRNRYQRARAVDPRPALRPSRLFHSQWTVFDVTYISTDAFRIGGWLLVPRDGKIGRGLVVGHGYGGRTEPEFDIPVRETVLLFPCFRGLSLSARPTIPQDPALHVVHGIDSRDDYIIGGCVEDLWTAVSALTVLYPDLAGKIGYSGISFGGGIGALALPFDERIDRGHLVVPTFGNRPLWLTLPTTGSAAGAQAYGKTHPEIFETLRLFDAASAATRIRIPMLVAAALFDPAVAPPCQFSVANALPKNNEIFTLDAGHFDYPDSATQHMLLRSKVRDFFKVR